MREQTRPKSSIWQPRGRVVRTLDTVTSIRNFNDQEMIPVALEALRSSEIKIDLVSSQSELFSFWDLSTVGRYARKPKTEFDCVTINFILTGLTNYIYSDGSTVGTPATAVLAPHQELLDEHSSEMFSMFGASISRANLLRIDEALTGSSTSALPLAGSADMTATGLRALYCTMRRVYQRSLELEPPGDLTFALMQEIMGYQLLAAWPRRAGVVPNVRPDDRPSRLSLAKDYIQASLAAPLTLSDIAEAAGLSVRALQDNFRRSVNQTPFEYIIHQRLMRVHDDLTTHAGGGVSVGDIARRWGFVHMSDFGQRYRRLYGCTPTETRDQATGRA